MIVKIFDHVGGLKLEKFLAKHKTTQAGLDEIAIARGEIAAAVLGAHRHEGDSYIEIESGSIDRYVVLNDEHGQGAAMTIEFGRKPDANGRGGMEAIRPLRTAIPEARGD